MRNVKTSRAKGDARVLIEVVYVCAVSIYTVAERALIQP